MVFFFPAFDWFQMIPHVLFTLGVLPWLFPSGSSYTPDWSRLFMNYGGVEYISSNGE